MPINGGVLAQLSTYLGIFNLSTLMNSTNSINFDSKDETNTISNAKLKDLHSYTASSNLNSGVRSDKVDKKSATAPSSVGTITSVSDGVGVVTGLPSVKVGEIVFISISQKILDPTSTVEGILNSKFSDRFTNLKKKFVEREVIFTDRFVRGLVLNLNSDSISLIVLGNDKLVGAGNKVFSIGKRLMIKTSLAFFGHVLNSLGDLIDKSQLGKLSREEGSDGEKIIVFKNASDDISAIVTEGEEFVEQKAKGIIDREPVRRPLLTGIAAIDSLVPIGRGQRELIIGDRQTGKTSIALDIILNHIVINNYFLGWDTFKRKKILQNSNGQRVKVTQVCTLSDLRNIVWFVYCGIGQKQSTINNIRRNLTRRNAMWYTAIVSATSSDSAPLQFLSPYSACTLGEFIRDWVGGHATVIFDDLSKHAVAYRQMSLLLRRPPGREAFPGDVFYVHSRLLERAGALVNKLVMSEGVESLQYRGTLTAFPVIETQAGDVSAYIPTNVISITDGQIFLESELFYRGIRPAVNVGLSVSRVGSAAQPVLMKTVSGSLKMELAQYREIESFAKLGADLDAHTKRLLIRGENLIEILKQPVHSPLSTFVESLFLFMGVGFSGKMLSRIVQLKNFYRAVKVSTLGSIQLQKPLFFNNSIVKMSWLEYIRLCTPSFTLPVVQRFTASVYKFVKSLGVTGLMEYQSVANISNFLFLKVPFIFLNDLVFLYFLERGAIGFDRAGSFNQKGSHSFLAGSNIGAINLNFLFLEGKSSGVDTNVTVDTIGDEIDNSDDSIKSIINLPIENMLYREVIILENDSNKKFKNSVNGNRSSLSSGEEVSNSLDFLNTSTNSNSLAYFFSSLFSLNFSVATFTSVINMSQLLFAVRKNFENKAFFENSEKNSSVLKKIKKILVAENFIEVANTLTLKKSGAVREFLIDSDSFVLNSTLNSIRKGAVVEELLSVVNRVLNHGDIITTLLK